jgi:hypothetical protein
MSSKTGRSRKQHTAEISIASIGNLEVISEENFLKRLEGMSSCEDCKHERSKSSQSKHRRQVKNKKKFRQQNKARTNSPIVIKLSDTLKPQKSRRRGSKGAKVEEETVNVNTASSGIISSSGLEMASSKSEKNFSAMISILEKCHQKHFSPEFSLNLNMDSSLCPERNVLLNNTRSPLPHTRNTPTSPKQFFVLSNNVDVICNDLSGKPSSVGEGDSSSLVSLTHSRAENGESNTILVEKDLSKEEMSQLVEYTTGFAVTRFDCMQLDCADCITWPSSVATCRSVEDLVDPDDDTDNSSESSDATDTDTATVISTSFSSSSLPSVSESTSSSSPVSSSDEHSSTTAETSSESEEDEKRDLAKCAKITKPKMGRTECALITKPKTVKAATVTKPKTVKATCSTKTFKKDAVTISTKGSSNTREKGNKKSEKDEAKFATPQIFTIQSKTGAVQGDSVYIDLTDCDVEISVFYHPKPTEFDWCYQSPSAAPCYDGYWYYPTSVPYTYFPSYYMQPPVVSIPRPLCVPRDQDILASSKTCMIPAHEIENCKIFFKIFFTIILSFCSVQFCSDLTWKLNIFMCVLAA